MIPSSNLQIWTNQLGKIRCNKKRKGAPAEVGTVPVRGGPAPAPAQEGEGFHAAQEQEEGQRCRQQLSASHSRVVLETGLGGREREDWNIYN